MRVIDLSTLSLVGGSGIAEAKIPLWWADGTYWAQAQSNPGQACLGDGSTNMYSPASSGPTCLIQIPSNTLTGTQFAFESTIEAYTSNTSVLAEIWDMTSNTGVTASQISTTTTAFSVIRSGKFTLTLGHWYGVTLWDNPASGTNMYISDASLIVFPS